MEIWYFETSAANYLMDHMTVEDAIATKALQLKMGRDWRISSVTLQEILMTADVERRENLIYFCQHLFGRELLPSPPEIIIDYIRQGMPRVENHRELISGSRFAEVWRELVDDTSREFQLDHKHILDSSRGIQDITKMVHAMVKHSADTTTSEKSVAELDSILSDYLKELPFVKEGRTLNKSQELTHKVSLYFILTFLCSEIFLENEPIKQFWEKLGLENILCRLTYVVNELPILVHRGPFLVMATMMISQATTKKFPRGVWFDCLHSIYVSYADKLFTTDAHFQSLRESIPEPILQKRIHHMKEVILKKTTHE